MAIRFTFFLLSVIYITTLGCANISSPTGGKRDLTPPKLLYVTPADSQLNTRVSKLVLQFDEYITAGDVQKEVDISPVPRVPPVVTAVAKHVTLKIPDSLLEENTTYRISFGHSVKDVHEGNAIEGYTYTFSTGSYFDSLQLNGSVLNAESGLPDTSGILIVLYAASENDTAIIKKKPRYKTRPDNKGLFKFSGLPGRNFRIYAIKDKNENMMYDGGDELVAFNDSMVIPADSFAHPVTLRLFAEAPDSASSADTALAPKKSIADKGKTRMGTPDTNFTYTVNIDTSNIKRRTFDLTDSIRLTFNKVPVITTDSIRLTYDSGKVSRDIPLRISTDTAGKGIVFVGATLKENTVYTLHMGDGFAADTLGHRTLAASYPFRTFNDDDYGIITLNVPGRYVSAAASDYLLVLLADDKVLYTRKVTDTTITIPKLKPASYTFRIIADKNKNGKWDTGNLLGGTQPEIVIPGSATAPLKAGWKSTIDFEAPSSPKDKNLKEKTNRK